ncbi:acyltransferase domain-containing protein [Streptomyces griseus]|uniref:acyltransferase domain-containing protein n=1 Tax=Streptomyces griseus TaxID=1911 RepID=UPI000B028CDB|nr:acyltransferase domain-containing protein [Streptomyces griseus]
MTRTPTTPDVEEWLGILGLQNATGDIPGPEPMAPDEALRRMRLLAVPAEDRGPVLATLPDPVRAPDRWQALRRCHRTLFSRSAPPPQETVWPDAPAALMEAGRYFYLHLYLLALPAALERQRRLGIPDDIVAATFADVGAKMTTYRLAHRTGGFDRQRWAMRHFRGTLHRIGRLQFERTTLDSAALGGSPGTDGPADGERVLAVHIPEEGPLTPAGCDASHRAARHLYAQHFPDEAFRFATCSSWLLDDQLAAYLPSTSNILRFQQRFTRFGSRPVGDADILQFVFHLRPGTTDLARLPQRTALQRAVVDHLQAGRHWHLAHGWTALPAPPENAERPRTSAVNSAHPVKDHFSRRPPG